MTAPEFRLFYRIVKTNPPTLMDFLSAKEKGAAEPRAPQLREVWDGLSVYSTAAQARRKQRYSPVLGGLIAVMRVPLDGSVKVRRTLGDGHHTLWAEATLLQSLVVSIELA